MTFRCLSFRFVSSLSHVYGEMVSSAFMLSFALSRCLYLSLSRSLVRSHVSLVDVHLREPTNKFLFSRFIYIFFPINAFLRTTLSLSCRRRLSAWLSLWYLTWRVYYIQFRIRKYICHSTCFVCFFLYSATNKTRSPRQEYSHRTKPLLYTAAISISVSISTSSPQNI